MKKAVVVLIVLALLGVGGYFYMNSKGAVPKITGAKIGTNSVTGGNVFTSIKDALSKSISLQCSFKDEKGVETTSYIKNGGVRVMMTVTDKTQPNNFIMKDKKMYMWSDQTNEGLVLEFDQPKDLTPPPTIANQPSSAPGQAQADQKESLLATIEKYKDACKPAVVADSMFTVPSEVKLQDMSQIQKQMMQGIPQAPQGTQPGAGNSGDYQKYLEEMMKKQQGGQ